MLTQNALGNFIRARNEYKRMARDCLQYAREDRVIHRYTKRSSYWLRKAAEYRKEAQRAHACILVFLETTEDPRDNDMAVYMENVTSTYECVRSARG